MTRTILMATLCALAACGADGGDRSDDDTSGSEASAGESSTTIATTTTPGTTNPGTTASTSASTADPSSASDSGSDASTGDEPYEFDDAPASEYTQVDRMGMPAVATALIASKDDYNHAVPADDATAEFVPEILDHLTALHAALDDDLEALGLTPCDVDTCAGQGAPLVVPDVLHIDLAMSPGFPNGRLLDDPVIDLTLAVILLDLEANDVTTFAELPLNPNENDEPLADDFPYMADPH